MNGLSVPALLNYLLPRKGFPGKTFEVCQATIHTTGLLVKKKYRTANNVQHTKQNSIYLKTL